MHSCRCLQWPLATYSRLAFGWQELDAQLWFGTFLIKYVHEYCNGQFLEIFTPYKARLPYFVPSPGLRNFQNALSPLAELQWFSSTNEHKNKDCLIEQCLYWALCCQCCQFICQLNQSIKWAFFRKNFICCKRPLVYGIPIVSIPPCLQFSVPRTSLALGISKSHPWYDMDIFWNHPLTSLIANSALPGLLDTALFACWPE